MAWTFKEWLEEQPFRKNFILTTMHLKHAWDGGVRSRDDEVTELQNQLAHTPPVDDEIYVLKARIAELEDELRQCRWKLGESVWTGPWRES